ncbi:MAG: peptidase M61 [Ignavibacteriae bacterium]|nr:peptidase M61 [Ignavibacteriota bacterium]
MRKLLIILFLCISMGSLHAQEIQQDESYHFFLDLNNIKNDQAFVEAITPTVSSESIVFYFPKVIPGTYRIADFGRFISDVKAFTKDGGELPVEKIETNGWRIDNAQSLYKITYTVDDTYDTDIKEDPIFKMGGTDIEEGKVYLVNTHGFFGYLQDMKDKEYVVEIKHPEGFYGATGMIPASNDNNTDVFITESYNRLVDSPIMYTRPDTTVMEVGGANVLVSVYSPTGSVQSKYMAENFRKVLEAQKEYLGGTLPVDKYAFILYFQDLSDYDENDEANHELGAFAFGALEHSYSSVYYMPDAGQENIISNMLRISAHEFFHIVTPLSIHSEEIQYFDFNEPKMSEHLWMYEGVIEYFAHHVQVKYGIKSQEEFFNSMSEKIGSMLTQYDDNLPFTVMSKGSLDQYKDQYLNVYEKGAIIGMLLDIKLLQLSDGKYNLADMMKDLSKRYGKDRPFKDEELFGTIVELTYPEIGDFLNTYVAGSSPLPLKEVMAEVGIDYKEKGTRKDFTLGHVQFGFNPQTKRLVVADISNMDEFGKAMGYKQGDEVYSINGDVIPEQGIQQFFEDLFTTFKEGDKTEMVVMRDGKKVTLSATMIKTERPANNQLTPVENPTPQQLKLRNAWLGTN